MPLLAPCVSKCFLAWGCITPLFWGTTIQTTTVPHTSCLREEKAWPLWGKIISTLVSSLFYTQHVAYIENYETYKQTGKLTHNLKKIQPMEANQQINQMLKLEIKNIKVIILSMLKDIEK